MKLPTTDKVLFVTRAALAAHVASDLNTGEPLTVAELANMVLTQQPWKSASWTVEAHEWFVDLVRQAHYQFYNAAKIAMANKLRHARETRYVVSVSPSGRKSASNGDRIAEALQTVDLDRLYALVELLLNVDCRVKYMNLNQGAQRMNLGNRLRAAYKKNHAEVCNWFDSQE